MKFLILSLFWNLSFSVDCNYISLEGNVLLNRSEINYFDSGVSKTLLSCARKCKNDSNCEGLVYNNTEGWCGLIDGNGLANTSQGLTSTLFEVKSRVEKKCGRWQKVLSVDRFGGVLSGSFENLKTALLSGEKLQIVIERKNMVTFSYVVNSAFVDENVACGQTEIYSTDMAEWASLLLCTNGKVQYFRSDMNLTESAVITQSTYFNKIDWFIFENSCPPVILTDDSKPYITFNNIPGFSVVVIGSPGAFMKINYKTHTDISYTGEMVEVTSLLEISSTFTGVDFEYVENSWITTKYNFSKTVEEIKCNMSVGNPCLLQEFTTDQIIFIDENWDKVFSNSYEGITVFGSLQSLKDKVSNGHRLLIRFSGKVREPDIIVLDEDNITAVFSLYPLKQFNSSKTSVLWELVSTSGNYEGVEFDFETGNVLRSDKGTNDCIWFVDKSTWSNVYDAEHHTTEKLIFAIESGSSIRIQSNCIYVNENSALVSCVYGANTLKWNRTSSEVTAMANLYPGLTVTDSGLHFSTVENPVWINLRTSTLDMSRELWMHKSPSFVNVTKINDKNNTWFAN